MFRFKIRLLLLFLLMLIGGKNLSIYAGVADPPTVTTDQSAPVYYVIQNWDTKYFIMDNGNDDRIWGQAEIKAKTSGTGKYSVDDYLWYFVADGSGYKICSKKAGANMYLSNEDLYSSNLRSSYVAPITHETGFNSTGTTWYIAKCQYNNVGVEIRTADNKYWESDKPTSSSSYGYIQLNSSANDNKQVWILWSFDDLVEEAVAHGYAASKYASLDPTAGSSFKTLVEDIQAAQNSSYISSFSSSFTNGQYLIRSRQYGTYLNTNGTGMAGTTAPTQYSVWSITKDGDLTIKNYYLDHIYVKDGSTSSPTWNIDNDGNVWHPTFTASSDNNNKYFSFSPSGESNNRWFGMGSTSTETKTDKRASIDWELIPVTTTNGVMSYTVDGTTYVITTSITDEEVLATASEADPRFFRIRNVARSVSHSATDDLNGPGGWLEDVDKMHFTWWKTNGGFQHSADDDESTLMYSARSVDFYTSKEAMNHASALWEFELVGHGAINGENATGLVSPEHDIYVIKNGNTGMYINANAAYPVTTDSKASATKFYLEKLIDGQYSLCVYGGTTSGTDSSNGSLYVGGNTDGYMGGLCWSSGTTPAVNTNSAWIISEAPTLELQLLLRDLVAEDGDNDNNHLYDWTTFYYPFDVKLSDQNPSEQTVNMYVGEWSGTYEYSSGLKGGSIKMTEINDVPALVPVFIRSTKNSGESYTKVILDVKPAGNGFATTSRDAYGNNVWKGIVESGDDINGANYFGANWRNYWVLSKNSKGYLRLLHPGADYLLPNRAYLDAETAEAVSGSKLSAFTMSFRDSGTTGINVVDKLTNDNMTVYNLQGQRVGNSLNGMPRGLYIVNGKKIFVK